MSERIEGPNGGWADDCIVHVALPLIIIELDALQTKDATATNSSAERQLIGMRMTLAHVAGSLGIVGENWLDELRAWVESKRLAYIKEQRL